MASANVAVLSPGQKFRRILNKNLDGIKVVAANALSPTKLLEVLCVAANDNQRLYECVNSDEGIASLIRVCKTSAELGLIPGGGLGHYYPVPFRVKGKMTCVGIIGYKGLVKLAMRSGTLSSIQAHNVYEHDTFAIDYSQSIPFVHKPQLTTEARGDYIGSYAFARNVAGAIVGFEWMDRDQVDVVRRRSKAADNGPWKTDTEQMRRKTPLRRLTNYLELSTETAAEIVTSEADEVSEILRDITPPPKPDADEAVRDALGLVNEPDEPEEPEDAEVVEEPWGLEQEPVQVELTEDDNVE